MEEVLEYIKELRNEMSLGQKEMAEKLGMTQNNYSRLERGEISLTIDRLSEIAKVLEVPISYFFDEDYEQQYEKVLDQISDLKKYIRKMAMKGKGVVDIEFDTENFQLDFAELKEKVSPGYYEEYDRIFEEIENKRYDEIDQESNIESND